MEKCIRETEECKGTEGTGAILKGLTSAPNVIRDRCHTVERAIVSPAAAGDVKARLSPRFVTRGQRIFFRWEHH